MALALLAVLVEAEESMATTLEALQMLVGTVLDIALVGTVGAVILKAARIIPPAVLLVAGVVAEKKTAAGVPGRMVMPRSGIRYKWQLL